MAEYFHRQWDEIYGLLRLGERTWRRPFVCPCCDGDGGDFEPETDEGYGPTYECGFCDGKGFVSIRGRLSWFWNFETPDWIHMQW